MTTLVELELTGRGLHEEKNDGSAAYIEHHGLDKGFKLTDEDLHKLLCLISHSKVPSDEGMDESDRSKLYGFMEHLSWNISDHLGYNLDEGEIDTHTYAYKTFEEMNVNA